jgi:phage protein D
MTTGKVLQTGNFYVPRFEIEIQNKKLPEKIANSIIDVSVTESLKAGTSFSFTVNDEFDLKKQEFTWLDHNIFNLGNTVTIKMGYGNPLMTLAKGQINSLEPSFFTGETPSISIRGQDLSYNYMKKKSPGKTFLNMSFSAIARDIAQRAGLSIKADKTEKKKGPIPKKSDESYFKFLQRLANKLGFEVSIDCRTLYFKKPGDDKKEVLVLELGKDIISFRPDLNTARLYSEVEVRWRNPRDPGNPIIGRAGAGSERIREPGKKTGSQLLKDLKCKQKKVITNVPVESVTQAKALAMAELNKISDNLIEGEAECIGIPEIRAGVCIRLEKMGKRFSGKYYVKSATHTINSSGYRTRFNVRRNSS